ncbi:hypothetical protein D9M72_438770 [compost metagenome]
MRKLTLEFTPLPVQRLGPLVQSQSLQITFARILGGCSRRRGPEPRIADLLVDRGEQCAEAFPIQLLDQAFARQARPLRGSSIQHRRPAALQVAMVELDRRDFVILVEQQLRVVDDGERQHAFA